MTSLSRRLTPGALSVLLYMASGAAADAAWVNTSTQAIPLVQATSLGALSPSTTLTIAVALQMQNAAALRNLVQQQNTVGSPYYNTTITPADFNATYAPSAASASAVQNYLAQSGFANISVETNRLFVTATGTAAQVQAAFNTSLGLFSQNGQTVFVNTKPAQVPSSLGGIVLSVLGLNNVQATVRPKITRCNITVSTTCIRFSYDPATYWKTYDVGTVSTGSQTNIAVMAEGTVTQTIKDLRTFE